MSNTPNLALPYLDANQNQKTVTHNAALTILDALVNCHVQSAALAAPPTSPADGQCWIVASGGTGAWVGKDLNIAAWQSGAWSFYPPNKGFVAYVDTLGAAVMWTGTSWTSLLGAITTLALNAIGIGTAVDPGNPLSAKLNSALFAALPTTASGTGNVRVSLSKQAAANTASFLFQDNFSGRAEIGLAGDDNFHFKVSPDGATFYDALVITAAGGGATLLNTPSFPTAPTSDTSTKGATTAFVANAVAAVTARTQVNDAAYTVLPTDRTVAIVALTAARTLTLPAASAYPAGATLTIVDESGSCSATNTITISRAGADTINGGTGTGLSMAFGYVALESNGFNKWTVIDQVPTAPKLLYAGNTGSINNSAAGSGAFHSHGLTYTLPANFLASGRVLRVTTHWIWSTGSAPVDYQIQLLMGATTVQLNDPGAPTAASTSNRSLTFSYLIQATAAPSAASPVLVSAPSNANATNVNVTGGIAQPVTLGTNGPLVLDFQSMWASAGTGPNTVQLLQVVVETLN